MHSELLKDKVARDGLVLTWVPAHVPLSLQQGQGVIELFRTIYGARYHKSYTTSVDALNRARADGGGASFLVSYGGDIIAHAAVRVDGADRCKFERSVVAPGHRRIGLGRLLATRGVAWAEAQGFRLLWTEVVTSHGASERAFAELGFKAAGLHLGKYLDYFNTGVRESTLVLYKQLTPPRSALRAQETQVVARAEPLPHTISSSFYREMSQAEVWLGRKASLPALLEAMERESCFLSEEYVAIRVDSASPFLEEINAWLSLNNFVFASTIPSTGFQTFQRFRPIEWRYLMSRCDLSSEVRRYLDEVGSSIRATDFFGAAEQVPW